MIAAEAVAGAPYRGLAPFGETELDALLFFGRERETALTTAHLIGSRLTVLYGPSGVGKSSLLRAGVARRLRELGARRAVGRGPDAACVVYSSWSVDDPVRAVADAIGREIGALVSPTAPQPPPGSTLADVTEHWTALLDGDLCLVLDQFEEYFVYADGGAADALVQEISELVTRPALRVNVLVSLRDDELSRLDVFKGTLPGVFANPRRLDRLDRDGGRAAIVGPLQRWNETVPPDEWVEIEPELVEAVLDAAAVGEQRRIEAPFLQLVMERVWNEERLRGSHVLRLSTLSELGGPQTLVREHLDRALGALDDEQQAAAAQMFGHLVTPSGTKIAHRASDLATVAHVGVEHGREILAALDRERIVRPLDSTEGGGDRYEIFHDVLAAAILDWTRRRELAAERVAARRRQRRLAILAGLAIAGLAVMAAIALYARAQERHARAGALSARAFAALPTDPEQSLVLARRAARYDRSRQVEDALRAALRGFRGRAVYRGHAHGVLAAGFTRAGVATVDGAGTIRVFPRRTAAPLSTRQLGGRVRAAAFAAGGDAVAVARRRLVTVTEPDSGRLRYAFRERAPIRAIAVDAAGRRVAVATIDGRVTVRDRGRVVFSARAPFKPTAVTLDAAGRTVAASGRAAAAVWTGRGRTLVPARDIAAVALSPDGTTLATAGVDGDARLWHVPGGGLANVVLTPTALTGATFSRDGKTLALAGRDGTTRVYDAETGQPLAILAGHRDEVTTAAFSATARSFVTGSADGTARLWDPGVAPELRVVASPRGCCAALTTAPAGVLVAAGTEALLYRPSGGVTRFAAGAPVTAVASSGDVVVTGGSDGRVQLWDANGTRIRLADTGGVVTAVAASPATVVAAHEGRVVRVLEGRGVRSIREGATIGGLAISHDGRMLAEAGADGVTRIRDLRSGKLRRSLVAADRKPLTAVAFSPDGDVVATSSYDHDVRLWSVRTGKLLHLLRAHFAVVSDVAFSADGRWLVTAGPSTAGLWRADDGSFIEYLRGHARRLVGAGFLGGDRVIATASVDGTVRSYRCDVCGGVDELVDLARQRLAAVGE